MTRQTFIADAVVTHNVSAYAAGTQTLDVTLSYAKIKAGNPTATTVYVVYEAKVTSDAVVATDTANNSVVLEYANPRPPTRKKTTEPSSADVYTYSFKLEKLMRPAKTLFPARSSPSPATQLSRISLNS